MKAIKTTPVTKIHVFPLLNRWAIFDEKVQRPQAVFIDPDEALKSARKMLEGNPSVKVFVHDKNGKIQAILDAA